MSQSQVPPKHELVNFGHAVAGHAGTMSDADGQLFIKPCTQTEIDFYNSARRRHPQFADLMPVYLGTLSLNEGADPHAIEDAVSDLVAHAHDPLPEQDKPVVVAAPTASTENSEWVRNGSGKIKTDLAIVLENAASGYKHPNILDAKLGRRLWADDAPQGKKQRLEDVSAETTHANLGFRIAGMRVYHGAPEGAPDLDAEGYKAYDRDFGRYQVNDDNIDETMRRFVFNATAGVDKELGQAVVAGFLQELHRIEAILAKHESRMYSASLLFMFEGDGTTLREAIAKNNAIAERIEQQRSARGNKARSSPVPTTARVDSGIVMDGDASGDDDEEEEDEEELPKILTIKLIDFAHATWTPGQGADENSLLGVRSLIRIFEKMAV